MLSVLCSKPSHDLCLSESKLNSKNAYKILHDLLSSHPSTILAIWTTALSPFTQLQPHEFLVVPQYLRHAPDSETLHICHSLHLKCSSLDIPPSLPLLQVFLQISPEQEDLLCPLHKNSHSTPCPTPELLIPLLCIIFSITLNRHVIYFLFNLVVCLPSQECQFHEDGTFSFIHCYIHNPFKRPWCIVVSQ